MGSGTQPNFNSIYTGGNLSCVNSIPYAGLQAIRRLKANWIGHILRRNCLLKHVIERNTGRLRRRGKRRKLLLDAFRKAIRYCKLQEEAPDRTLWRIRFGRGCGLRVCDG